tara:strand:- start:1327 stop:1785 length:459 start_codon:yes stop_codon:yes gene_type:complete
MKKLFLLIFLSPLLLSLEQDLNNCDSVELFFNSPKDGFQTAESSFKVEFGSKNIFISPAGEVVERIDQCNVSGHHHLIINKAYNVTENIGVPIPFDKNVLHFGGGQIEAELSLPPGKYVLQLALGDYQHIPVLIKDKKDIALSKEINIEILP